MSPPSLRLPAPPRRGGGPGFATLLVPALLACPAAASAILGAPPAAQSSEPERALLERLEEHVQWCQRNRLFALRNEAWELVLDVDPDHGAARRALGYRKKQGEWVLGETRPARNFDERAALEAPERLVAAVEPYCDELFRELASGDADAARSARLAEEILRFQPAHPGLRELREEVLVDGEWVLRETAAAGSRRARLEELVAAATERVAPGTDSAPNLRESGFGLGFHVVATPELRVLATRGAEEARTLSSAVRAARQVFAGVFGVEAQLPPGCTVYLLEGATERDAFLGVHPDLDDEQRRYLAQLGGSGIPGTADWAFWATGEAARRDGIVRMAFGYFLNAAFRLPYSAGWAHEGLGLYLTKAMVGTRMTWFAGPGEGGSMDLGRRNHLLNPKTNWMREANDVLAVEPPRPLAPMLAKGAGELDVDDLLRAYALCAYLVEGRAEELPTILGRLGAGEQPGEVLSSVLGRDEAALARRLRRWVEQNFARELAPPLEAARLLAVWAKLDDDERTEALAAFRARLGELKTASRSTQVALIESSPVEEWPAADPAPHFDPKVHARADPIRRRALEDDDETVLAAQRRFLRPRDPRQPILAFEYDWIGRRVVRTGDPDDPETVFRNAANGYAPGHDLARALALQALDGGHHAALLAAFSHAYTDRDGGIYPGLTLYDAWTSQREMEMPDVDVLGIVHDVLDDWDSWVAPISGAEHGRLYGVVEGLFRRARSYRTLREALADCLLDADPWADRFLRSSVELHALWADAEGRADLLAARLPDADAQDAWLEEWARRCRDVAATRTAGEHRRGGIEADRERVARLLEDALVSTGALSPGR